MRRLDKHREHLSYVFAEKKKENWGEEEEEEEGDLLRMKHRNQPK